MNIGDEFLWLSAEKKRLVHLELCENALRILNEYFEKAGRIRYVETIAGTEQFVDPQLPADAFLSAKSGRNLLDAMHRFAEPIAALQTDDLEFPENVEFAFYSIYNLFLKYAAGREIDDWLIVNQALSAEIDAEKWVEMLTSAVEKAR